jgi:hypothetical protein
VIALRLQKILLARPEISQYKEGVRKANLSFTRIDEQFK